MTRTELITRYDKLIMAEGRAINKTVDEFISWAESLRDVPSAYIDVKTGAQKYADTIEAHEEKMIKLMNERKAAEEAFACEGGEGTEPGWIKRRAEKYIAAEGGARE